MKRQSLIFALLLQKRLTFTRQRQNSENHVVGPPGGAAGLLTLLDSVDLQSTVTGGVLVRVLLLLMFTAYYSSRCFISKTIRWRPNMNSIMVFSKFNVSIETTSFSKHCRVNRKLFWNKTAKTKRFHVNVSSASCCNETRDSSVCV